MFSTCSRIFSMHTSVSQERQSSTILLDIRITMLVYRKETSSTNIQWHYPNKTNSMLSPFTSTWHAHRSRTSRKHSWCPLYVKRQTALYTLSLSLPSQLSAVSLFSLSHCTSTNTWRMQGMYLPLAGPAAFCLEKCPQRVSTEAEQPQSWGQCRPRCPCLLHTAGWNPTEQIWGRTDRKFRKTSLLQKKAFYKSLNFKLADSSFPVRESRRADLP